VTARLGAAGKALAYVALALILCGAIFTLAGYSALDLFANIVQGAILAPHAFVHTLRWTLPLFVTALGVVITFRCGYFNIGAQGQFYAGGIAAGFAVDALRGAPPALGITLTIAAGIGGGAAWALVPGLLRVRSGTDEVITTLMGNFIAALALAYVTSGPLKDDSGSGQVAAGRPVTAALRIASSSGVSPTLGAIVVAAGLLIWLLVDRTAFGVLGSLAGRNPVMVVWQGARSAQIAIAAFALSGGLAGLAGALELLGPSGRLVSGSAPTLGFGAVLIALVCGLSVPAAAIVSLFFGGLAAASLYLPVIAGLPSAAINIINAAITLVITSRAWPEGRARAQPAARREAA
jgi:simple sugar transport system permease protein